LKTAGKTASAPAAGRRKEEIAQVIGRIKKNWQLYAIIALPVMVLLIFSYGPMYGLQIAFKDFVPTRGFAGSKWVGMKHFQTFVTSYQFGRLIKNTLLVSLYSLAAGFPAAIILAVAINECKSKWYKKTVQMITYAPHFISTVVMAGIVIMVLSPYSGVVNNIIQAFGGERIDFMANAGYFRHIYVWSGVWQNMGFNSIIYISALASIDPTLHEAAVVDGAGRWQRIWNIDLPGISSTIIIMLIMNCGHIMSVGYEKILLLQNSVNMSTSDVISTYVYRIGLQNAQYSFSTAVGLFNGIINCILLVSVNKIAKRVSETSLW
jgi:putative aldouronate transport system permease protein